MYQNDLKGNKNMIFDQIRLTASLDEAAGDFALSMTCNIEINGKLIHSELSINLMELVKSAQCGGCHDIFTCGCGISDCAGIASGVEVEHLPDAVIWRYSEPISSDGYLHLSIDEWTDMQTEMQFKFNPDQYQECIQDWMIKIKSLAISTDKPISFPGNQFNLKLLLAIETQVFSCRINAAEKLLITKNIEFDAYNDTVMAGGIYYELSELHLPESLCSAYRLWKEAAIFPNEKEELPAYLLYLEKGRQFCMAVREYLRSDALVKLRYHPPKIYNAFAWEIIEEIR